MILTVDIGNTNIVIGCFEGKRLCFLERFETNQRSASLEYAVIFRETFSLYGIDASAVEGGIISSVVPSVTDTVKLAARTRTVISQLSAYRSASIRIVQSAPQSEGYTK